MSPTRRTCVMPDPSHACSVTDIVSACGDAPALLGQMRLVDGLGTPRMFDVAPRPAPRPTLLWIGCSGCSGETQALLGVEGQALDLV